jgi:hypothetical protein
VVLNKRSMYTMVKIFERFHRRTSISTTCVLGNRKVLRSMEGWRSSYKGSFI